MKNNIIIVAILVVIVLAILTFSNNNENVKDNSENTKDFIVGFIVPTLDNPYFVDMTEAAKVETAKTEGLELLVQASAAGATDAIGQIEIVESMILQQVDAIVIVPTDSKALVPAVAKANAANIPVFIVDNNLDEAVATEAGVKTETFIGSDNFLGGQRAGEFIADLLSESGQVAILEGISGTEAAVDRKAGFEEALSNFPAMSVVASQTANWSREEALNVTPQILLTNPELKAIFASNDEMALGAIKAIEEAGKKEQVIVVGFDAVDEAIAAVEAGDLAATVAQQPDEMGRISIVKVLEFLNGNAIEEYIPTELKVISL